jgi:hypothetical protein
VFLLWDKTDNGETGGRCPGTYLMPLATRESRFLTPQTGVLFGSKTRLGAVPDDRVDLLWCAGTEIRYACLNLTEAL